MKTIRIILLALAINISLPINCNAQWGWLVDQFVGALVDEIAGELGASDANAAIEKSIRSHSKDVKLDINGYLSTMNKLWSDSRKNAFRALSRNGQGDEATYQSDLDFTYKGVISLPLVSQSIVGAMKDNVNSVAGNTIYTARSQFNPSSVSIETLLGSRVYSEWRNKTTLIENKLKTDIDNDLDLIPFFRNVPGALNVYSMISNSDMRLSRELLMFLSKDIGIMSGPWRNIWPGYSWGDGSDLSYKTSSLGKAIEVVRGGLTVAVIEKKAGTGFNISSSEMARVILNLYPLANSTYTCGSCTWETDDKGRVKHASVTLNRPAVKVKRDAVKGSELSYLKDSYSTLGYAVDSNTFLSDIELYLIPQSMGGYADLINSVPVKFEIAKSADLKALDKDAMKLSKKGITVTRSVDLSYDNEQSMRPGKIVVSQVASGYTRQAVTIENR